MNTLPAPRLFPALAGALLVTVAVFLFMQSLIQRGQREDVTLAVYENVQILRQQPEEKPPEQEQEAPEEVTEQPVMDSLAVAPPTPTPTPAPELQIPAPDLALGDLNIQAVGDRWSAPLGAGAVNLAVGGQDAQGFIEVVPFNTRRPNVPEVAWQNKIDGWVLVAFKVTPQGGTRDVRVLDARPRGVFEEKVIAAVQDWQYTLNYAGKPLGNVVLTQKVEVHWKHYPENLPNVD